MTRLWDRGTPLDEVVERLTVGRDPELDLSLVAHDAMASAAHADMLASIGVLTAAELEGLLRELRAISKDAKSGTFEIATEDEDGHTAIENRLTDRLGDAGRRIHTGRSRNDQVIAALRLWGREQVAGAYRETLDVVDALLDQAAKHRDSSMPGYSHTRQAMPTTFGHFLAAFAENLLDDLPWLERAFEHLNRSPLGSASGFGVALDLDRSRVADLLGFSGVQVNTLAVQNDRGKSEWLSLGALVAVTSDLGRLASDLIWMSSDELGFVGLPEAMTTGSSIMPQKRNPDVLELIRAGAGQLRGRHSEVAGLYASLGAGYHRDLQLTKAPFLEGVTLARDILRASAAVISGLELNVERAKAAVVPATGSTDALYLKVAAGEPFRSAYKEVARDPEGAVSGEPSETWRARRHSGAPGALDIDAARRRATAARASGEMALEIISSAWRRFSGGSSA